MATRSDFISSDSISAASVNWADGEGSSKLRASPFMCSFITQIFSRGLLRLLGLAQHELAGHGAAVVVGLNDDGGVWQGGLVDLDGDLGAACGIGDHLGIK